MSLASGLHAFVADPGSLSWRPAQMYAQGFRSLVIHLLGHELPIWWNEDRPRAIEHARKAVELRDEARAAGMAVYPWQTLHPGFNPDLCAAAALAQAPHWDGFVPNLETALLHPESDRYCGLLIASLPAGYPLGVSTEPTFPLTTGLRLLEAFGAVLMPQAYKLENGHTPASARSFAIDRPPVYVGWRYWIDFHGLEPRRVARAVVTVQDGQYVYRVKEGANTWGLDELSRRVTNRQTGKWVGTLRGLWLLPRVAPTVRTTAYNGQWLPAAEQLTHFRAARFVGGSLPNRGGIYLAETTEDPADWRL